MRRVAVDIETLGLLFQKPLPSITCVCLYDGHEEHSLVFYGVSAEQFDANRERLLTLLDDAECIVGFNAVLFDLEYIRRFFKLSKLHLELWVRKTLDPYHYMTQELQHSCKLSTLLAMNGLESKSGSGLQAIVWAKTGLMDRVVAYCMRDARLTYEVCALDPIRINEFWTVRPQVERTGVTWTAERSAERVPTLGGVLCECKPCNVDALLMEGHVALCIEPAI